MGEEEIKRVLEDHERRLKELEEYVPKKELVQSPPKNLEERIKNLCEEIGVDFERFYEFFYLKDVDKEITLLFSPLGKSESEKQIKSALILLTILERVFEKDFMTSSDLNKKLKKMKIGSLVNLSTNFSKYKNFLIPRGKSKSTKFGFQITIPGQNEGLKIIKDLCKNG